MLSVSRAVPRVPRSSSCASCLSIRQLSTSTSISTSSSRPQLQPPSNSSHFREPLSAPSRPKLAQKHLITHSPSPTLRLQTRSYASASRTSADETIEEIQEQYGTARDEFEIASEETEKKSVYASDDRAAAREELNALKDLYDLAVAGVDGEEVKRRVGQRIRELDMAVQALERSALEH